MNAGKRRVWGLEGLTAVARNGQWVALFCSSGGVD